METKDNIAEVLEIEPANIIAPSDDFAILEDSSEFADKNIKTIIENGKPVLEELKVLCSQTQHHLVYQAYAALFKELIMANKSLMETKKIHEDIKFRNNENDNKPRTQNNLFVGSTAELAALMENMKKEKQNDIV